MLHRLTAFRARMARAFDLVTVTGSRASALLWLCAALCWPGLAHAAPACSPLHATVTYGSSVHIDLSSCEKMAGWGVSFVISDPSHGNLSNYDKFGAATDYTPTDPNAASDSFVFSIDSIEDPNDFVTVNITIIQNQPTVTIGNASAVTEGGSLVFPVTLNNPASSSITIPLTYSGTATAGSDYTGNPTALTIPAGQTSGTVTLTTLPDTLVEGPETVIVQLGAGTGYTLGGSHTGSGTINDAVAVTVAPASLPNGTVGSTYNQSLSATGGTGPYTWTVTSGALPTGLGLTSDGQLSGTPTAGGTFNFTVGATDTDSHHGTRDYALVIATPVITLSPATLAAATQDSPYTTVMTASGGTAPYTFVTDGGALPHGLSLNSNGTLSGTPTEIGTFNFSVRATDSSTGTGPYSTDRAYTLSVASAAVVANPVAATVAYDSGPNPITLNITGGTATAVNVATTANHGSALASGTSITYQPNPGYAGNDNFTYTAGNTAGTSAPATVSITVSPPTLTLSPAAGTLTLDYNTAYARTFDASGGAAPYSYTLVGALPAGLHFDAASGTLSGTPSQSGSFPVTVTATDSSTGSSAPFSVANSYTLQVNAAAIVLNPASLPAATIGGAYSQNLTATGGTGPYTFSLGAGSLPAGLSLTAAGNLSGTPTEAGSFNVTIKATDANDASGQQAYTIMVAEPTVVLNPASLPSATAGQAYSQTVHASGGLAPYTYAITNGGLPGGMNLDTATGTLSGTPTSSGDFNFRITATDSSTGTGAPFSASQDYTLHVSPPKITLNPTTVPDPTAGTPYTQTITARGGTAPYTYAFSGTLPTGLHFDTGTGTLAGTPTISGDFSFKVTATDSSTGAGAPFSAVRNYALHVKAPRMTIAPASLPDGMVASAYPTTTFSASNGIAPYTFTLSGTLPAGLNFNAGTATLSGTPTEAGSFNLTVTAADVHDFTVTAHYTLTIGAATVTLNPASLPDATAETAYVQAITASGGTAPYSYTATGTLPAGITLDASTGALAGTPAVNGDFSFKITATDSSTGTGAPFSDSRDYTLHVDAPAITLTPAKLPAAKSAATYHQQLTASGGNGSYSFKISSGALPAGLSLGNDGNLSGTPGAAGNFTFTVTATDGLDFSGQQAYTLNVDEARPVAAADSASVDANQPVTIHVTANDSGPIDTIAVDKAPAHGTADIKGLDLVYTPASNFFGDDTLTYTASGPGGTSVAATVTISVKPLAVPGAKALKATTLAGKAVTINATQGATGGPFTTVTIASAPANGSATVSGNDIVYTPTADASGKVSFSYTLTNAFGASKPATVTVTVNPRPSAVSQQLSMVAGTTIKVDLTAGAHGGPFTGATVVSVSPSEAGSASVHAGKDGYQMDFTGAPAFSGTAKVSFTLSNAYATSAPGVITLTITPRSDPSRDPEVLGILGAQVDAARRFATSQIANFQQHLESLHGHAGGSGFHNGLSFTTGSNSRHMARDANGRMTQLDENNRYLVMPENRQPAKNPDNDHPQPGGSWSIWTGGAVNFGARELGGSSNGIDFTTSGISVGADKRLSSTFILGGGLGYGHDATDIGRHGSRSTADSYNLALYASFQPTESTYLDSLLSYQWLSFDSHRYVTDNGNRVNGNRDGKQAFASVAFGYEHHGKAWMLSPYGRLDVASATLDHYTEHGDAIYSLDYRRQKVKTTRGSLGLRTGYTVQRDFGTFMPQLRVEYQHDFQGASEATMSYADLLAGPLYHASVGNPSENHTLLGLGAQLQTVTGWQWRFEYQNMFDASSHHNQSVLLGIEKQF